jgi:hypothetical protein
MTITSGYNRKYFKMNVFTRLFKILVLCSINIVILNSCNYGKKSRIHEPLDRYEDHIIISLKIKFLNDDKFELYYKNEEEQFTSDKRVQIEVKGSQDFQTVLFVLDHHIFPSHIRLDFGMKENQDKFVIDQLAFKYNDVQHVFSNEEVRKYFRPHDGLHFNFNTMTGQGFRVNGRYDPYLVSNNISYFINKLILF